MIPFYITLKKYFGCDNGEVFFMDKREEQQYRSERMRKRRRRRRRKRLLRRVLKAGLLALLFILLVLFVFLLKGFLDGSTETVMLELPWSFGSTDIVLDAGHGGKDQGTSYEDILEKDINLEIAKKTEDILKKSGYQVRLTREDDTFIELSERAEEANRRNAKVFVSIHCNSLEKGQADGIETYYAEAKEEGSRALAEAIQTKASEQTKALDRGAKTADYVVIKETEMPAALIEVGFLSDAQERALLLQEEYQQKLAEGIAAGILEYLESLEALE